MKKEYINKLLFNSIIELPQFEQYYTDQNEQLKLVLELEHENKNETVSVFKSEKQLEEINPNQKGEITLVSGKDTPISTADKKKKCKC